MTFVGSQQRRDLKPLLRYLAYSAIAIRRWCLRLPTSGGFHQIASSQSTHFLSKDSVWEDWGRLGESPTAPPLRILLNFAMIKSLIYKSIQTRIEIHISGPFFGDAQLWIRLSSFRICPSTESSAHQLTAYSFWFYTCKFVVETIWMHLYNLCQNPATIYYHGIPDNAEMFNVLNAWLTSWRLPGPALLICPLQFKICALIFPLFWTNMRFPQTAL